MPTVPMMDPGQIPGFGEDPSGMGMLGGGKPGVGPEHVLMAAATMHELGRLGDPGGPRAAPKLPSRAKPTGGGRGRRK